MLTNKWALPLSACSWKKLEIADVCGGDTRGGESQTKKQFANQAWGSKESLGLSSAIHKQFQPLSRHDLSKFFGRVSPAIATGLVMSKAVSLAVPGSTGGTRARKGRGERRGMLEGFCGSLRWFRACCSSTHSGGNCAGLLPKPGS